ncbi:MAG: hypothetical protein ACI4K9_02480 [Candidatus Fimenecus sp.]
MILLTEVSAVLYLCTNGHNNFISRMLAANADEFCKRIAPKIEYTNKICLSAA